MSVLSDAKSSLSTTGLPVETGAYQGTALNYIIIIPIYESSDDVADNTELTETSGYYINLYYVGNYDTIKEQIKGSLRSAGFYISECRYIEKDTATNQHHLVITIEFKEVL